MAYEVVERPCLRWHVCRAVNRLREPANHGSGWTCYGLSWVESGDYMYTNLNSANLVRCLTLTPQARLKFCRTHTEPEEKDPEEALMDVIAGEVGFCPQLVRPHATDEIHLRRLLSCARSFVPTPASRLR